MDWFWIFVVVTVILSLGLLFSSSNTNPNNPVAGGPVTGGARARLPQQQQQPQRGGNSVSSGGWRKVILNVDLIFNKNPDGGYTLASEKLAPLLVNLASTKDLYTVAKVTSDEEERQLMEALESTGIFNATSMSVHKALFCETTKGKEAIARQIEPHVYIDDDLGLIKTLSQYIPRLVYIPPSTTTAPQVNVTELRDNVHFSSSLEEFLVSLKDNNNKI